MSEHTLSEKVNGGLRSIGESLGLIHTGCKHEKIDPYAEYSDEPIWSLINEEITDYTYWLEYDSLFSKHRHIDRTYACKGCGETTVVRYSEELEGDGNVILKSELDDADMSAMKKESSLGCHWNTHEFRAELEWC